MSRMTRECCKICKSKPPLFRCAFHDKEDCPTYMAELAIDALCSKESALKIPVEVLIHGLRQHGITGELRQVSVHSI